MKNLNSNLVAIVRRNEDEKLTDRLLRRLQQKNIFISELIHPEIPNFEHIIKNSDSQIILTFLSKNEVNFENFFSYLFFIEFYHFSSCGKVRLLWCTNDFLVLERYDKIVSKNLCFKITKL